VGFLRSELFGVDSPKADITDSFGEKPFIYKENEKKKKKKKSVWEVDGYPCRNILVEKICY
jgi:hypothetical protein